MFCLDHHDPRRQGVLKLSTQDAGLSLEAQPSTLVESLSHQHENSEDRVMTPPHTHVITMSLVSLTNFHSRMQPDVGNTPSVTCLWLATMFLLNTSSPHLL